MDRDSRPRSPRGSIDCSIVPHPDAADHEAAASVRDVALLSNGNAT